MTDPLIVKILWGLIATGIMSIIITAIGYIIGNKSRELVATQDKSKAMSVAVGFLVYLLIIGTWYIGLIWYWFSLLAQVE